jgi:hypothetical protein
MDKHNLKGLFVEIALVFHVKRGTEPVAEILHFKKYPRSWRKLNQEGLK